MNGPVDTSDFLAGFLVEAKEILAGANAGLLALDTALEHGKPTLRTIRELFRLMHTMKGLAAMLGVEPIVAIAHAMETVLRAADRGEMILGKEALGVLFTSVSAIAARVRDLAAGRTAVAAPAELLASLDALEAGSVPLSTVGRAPTFPPEIASKLGPGEQEQLAAGIAEGQRAIRAEFVPSRERAEHGVSITSVRQALALVGDLVKVIPITKASPSPGAAGLRFVLVLLTLATDEDILRAVPDLEPDLTTLAETAHPSLIEPLEAEEDDDVGIRGRHVRVNVERLDDAMGRLSELIVSRSRLLHALDRLADAGVDVREIRDVLHDNARALKGMRGAILGLRMVTMAAMLEPLGLLVRGLRASTQRAVRLEIEGGAAELDKAVAERVWPAIVHLVRNAVDHGLEDDAVRRAAGKPLEGRVRIRCGSFSSSMLEIRVEDDGAGIDIARLAARAAVPLPDDADGVLELLCRPGLSSKDQASTTSGRGIGMDIVKRIVVDELGGDLAVETIRGKGTTFVLRVPLTVAIVEAFRFACGDQAYVVPVSSVEEVLNVDDLPSASAPRQRPGTPTVRLLQRRDETVSLVDLGALLGHPAAARPKALLLRNLGVPLAFSVDRMLGQQEVVVRPLKDPLVDVPGVAGSTDLGDGRPTLVLDLLELSARMDSLTGYAP